jgi:predicted nucleotide-binding protein
MAKPTLFIGSSGDGLPVAKAVEAGLGEDADICVWDEGIFDLTESTLTSLLNALDRFRFDVFILSPDDTIRIHQKESQAARDNVVFELGLFLGRLGPERTFFVRPSHDDDMRLPSDLLGRTAALYDGTNTDIAAA